jgi:hypothetical protein
LQAADSVGSQAAARGGTKAKAAAAPKAEASPGKAPKAKRGAPAADSSADVPTLHPPKRAKAAASKAAPKARSKAKVTSKVDADEAMSGGAIAGMAKAEAFAVALRKSRHGKGVAAGSEPAAGSEGGWAGLAPPTVGDVTACLLAMGPTWPTQQR